MELKIGMSNGPSNSFLSFPTHQAASWCCTQGVGLAMLLSTQSLEKAWFSSHCSHTICTKGRRTYLGCKSSWIQGLGDFCIPCSKMHTFIYEAQSSAPFHQGFWHRWGHCGSLGFHSPSTLQHHFSDRCCKIGEPQGSEPQLCSAEHLRHASMGKAAPWADMLTVFPEHH